MFDLNNLDQLSDTIDTDVSEEYAPPSEFAPPMPPGTYNVALFSIQAVTESGASMNVEATLKVLDGDCKDRELPFTRFSSTKFKRGSGLASGLDDVLWAARQPICKSNRDRGYALKALLENHVPFAIRYDWRAMCGDCYGNALVTLTGEEDVEIAKRLASKAQKKQAGKMATLAKSSRAFPVDADGKLIPEVKCNECSEETLAKLIGEDNREISEAQKKQASVMVRAQGNIVSYRQTDLVQGVADVDGVPF